MIYRNITNDRIRDFCIENKNKSKIGFNTFKDPRTLNNHIIDNISNNTLKGELFELLLTELFSGNGYLVERIGEGGNDGGCDLLVKYPKDNSIKFVVQAKNWNKAISINDIDAAWKKFDRNFKRQNNLVNDNFCFIAWNYVKIVKNQIANELNINIWDEQDIIDKLFKTYNCQHPKYPTILLKNHQEKAFINILSFWKRNKRCYVEHATGTGKTYIIAKIIETLIQNPENRTLVISPSTFINNRIIELIRNIIPLDEIAKKPNIAKKVNVLTYQYLYHNAKNILPEFYTHIIMDEAHRAGAPQWNKKGILPIISQKTRVVGLSATMERYSKGLDVKKFLDNNCAGKISLFRAIALRILPEIGKYVYSVLDIDTKIKEVKTEINTKYKKSPIEKKKVRQLLNVTEVKDYSIQKIIYKYYHTIQYRKIVVFCEGIEHVNNVRNLLDNTFIKFSKVEIERVTSKQSKAKNKEILDQFSLSKPINKQIKIIVAIDMLNEGIDLKGIDSIMLFRKTESPRVYLQQIGRVLRNNGKENPLIFDCVLNYQNVKVNLLEESQKEISRYKKSLEDFGFTDFHIPKTITIHDEVKEITEVIKKVETKLNFYRSYEHAKEAAKKLGINSEKNYRKHFRNDPRLPSKPHILYNSRGWIDWHNFFGRETPIYYDSYSEAKSATQKRNIKSFIEYRKRYKEDPKLPSQPDRTYGKNGWISWADYFGTTEVSIYKTYNEAKVAVRALKIISYTEYKKRYSENSRLPSNPSRKYYKKGWANFNEFLGITKTSLYQTYKDAKKAVDELKIKSEKEYRKRHSEDKRLPTSPARYYANKGWVDNYHFFGKPKPSFYSEYLDAKNVAKKLGIKSRKEYKNKYSLDHMLPSDPATSYIDKGWVDYFDFLDIPRPDFYKTYKEAKTAANEIGIKSRKEYVELKRYQVDSRLPSQPNSFYRGEGWTKWNDFIENTYNTYNEAVLAVRKLGIKTRNEYISQKMYKKDSLLPSDPEKRYTNHGWVDWYHFLGTEAPSIYSYNEAKQSVSKLKILSMKEYKVRRYEDPQLPSSPSECYKNKGWESSSVFLNIEKQLPYESYEEAKKAVKKLGIRNRHHYHDKKLYKKDSRLPSTPDLLYKTQGWVDWYSFLDIDPVDIYPTYEEAKKAVKKLGIKTGEAYRKQKLYKLDSRLPSTPEMKYRNKGWIDFYDFLGIASPKKYNSYEEAKMAAHKLKVRNIKEYHTQKRYLEDLRLTCNPDRKFKNNGWVNWEDFLGC